MSTESRPVTFDRGEAEQMVEQPRGFAPGAIDGQLQAALAEIDRLTARRDELLVLVARISQSTPLPDELAGWESQRAALVAEVGTLRAANAELERERDAARAEITALRPGRGATHAIRTPHHGTRNPSTRRSSRRSRSTR